MRSVTFTFTERLILTPVEIQVALKPSLILAMALFLLSGIGPGLFSLTRAWSRGLTALGALWAGIMTGAVIVPALLPHIPVTAFALKGILAGSVIGLLVFAACPPATLSAAAALFVFIMTVSSYLAMNFTGTTPFTSPSGVEKEMRQYIPIQVGGLVTACGLWIYAAF